MINSVNKLFNEFKIPQNQVKKPSKSRMGIMSIIREEIIYYNLTKEMKNGKFPILLVVGSSHIKPESILIRKFLKSGINFVSLIPKKYFLEEKKEYLKFYN